MSNPKMGTSSGRKKVRAKIQEFYDEITKKGLQKNKSGSELIRFQRILAQIGKYCSLDEINSVLDIGCNIGKFLQFLPFKYKYGVDISPFAVKIAKNEGVNAKVVDVEAEKLPYKANFFDMVFCMEILEHLFDASLLFLEIKRVLKPRGYLYITVPNQLFKLRNRLAILAGWYTVLEKNPYKACHIRFFKKNVLRDLVLREGFKVIYVGGLPVRFRGHSFGGLGGFLATRFTDLFVDYTLLAQKPG